MELWFRAVQWIADLNARKIAIFLLSVLVSLLLYRLYNLEQENGRMANRIDARNNRCDSIISAYEIRIQEVNDKRTDEIKAAGEYWKTKVEELQERLYEEHKTLHKIRR